MATLFKGAAQITIDPDSVELAAPIVIDRDDQLSECVISAMLETSPLNSQGSSMALDYIQTGAGLSIEVSIADQDLFLQLLALSYETTVVVDAITPTKKKVLVQDFAGIKKTGYEILIKPYSGTGVSTDANTWIRLTNGKQESLDGTNFTFGLETQQEMRLTFQAMPDANSVKVIFGDETATP